MSHMSHTFHTSSMSRMSDRVPSLWVAVVVGLGLVGCTSPSEQVCQEDARCAGDEDPATTCAEQKLECDEDESCASDRKACQTQNDTLSQCVLSTESSCQVVDEVSFYLPDDSEACADELDALLACVADG